MLKSALTKVTWYITYPFRQLYDFFQFNIELDREIADNRNKRDAWVDRKMAAEQEKAINSHTGKTEHFESFTCDLVKLNNNLVFFQSQKEKLGFQKLKVDSMVPMERNKVTVLVRYFSPIPRDVT